MSTFDDLFFTEHQFDDRILPLDLDPFADPEVLLEAQILEVRFDGIGSNLGVLFEMRMVEYGWVENAGLLVAYEVAQFSWSQPPRRGLRTAWTVLTTIIDRVDDNLTLKLSGMREFSLTLEAKRASFYAANIEALAPAPPDYGQADFAAIRRELPRWDTPLQNVRSVHSN